MWCLFEDYFWKYISEHLKVKNWDYGILKKLVLKPTSKLKIALSISESFWKFNLVIEEV